MFIALLIGVFCLEYTFSQTGNISIYASLNTEKNELNIQQEIEYFNNADFPFATIQLNNWPNSYKDKNTPLAKRFVENYSKSFHFTTEKNRGNTSIKSISSNFETLNFEITTESPDLITVFLKEPLLPRNSVKISILYTVKFPRDKFTSYGFGNQVYNLRYWYIAPAVFKNGWQTYSNLDMDDLYIDNINYKINIDIPKDYHLISDLAQLTDSLGHIDRYSLVGLKRQDVELIITKNNNFTTYPTNPVMLISDMGNEKLSVPIKTEILNRELSFLESYLGSFPNKKLLINKIEYDKNPVYGFNQLPSFLAPFSDIFEFDINFFKILSKKYIDHVFLFNQRNDYWLAEGLQTYLMMKYVEKFYPEVKAIGNVSKIWGIKNFNLAKIDFNESYSIVYQFAARKNLDQALITRADSLSNFNRKIVNKYKAGLGLRYLENYLEKDVVKNAILQYSNENSIKYAESYKFLDYLKTEKNIDWFKNDYIKTNKKIDYTISGIEKIGDSIKVNILNKRNFTIPVELYGIKNKHILFSKWLTEIDSTLTVTIPKNGFDRLSLNYESFLPEYDLKNNWKNTEGKLFNRPIQFKIFRDIENPYYNQIFYTPEVRYNYYDGFLAGVSLTNKTILDKIFSYKLNPFYGTKSNKFSGSYSVLYEYLPENNKINKFSAGVVGSNFQYAKDLNYNTLTPFALLEFKRKSLRDVSGSAISASYTLVDREKSPTQIQHIETNKYNVFNIGYGYSKPDIIEDIRFSTGFQLSNKFSKVSLTGHYRILTDANTQFDFRVFAGAFLKNNTETNFFDFALDRPTDYLFQYDYLGRSETSGFMSQQIIINEGGFKSQLPVSYANQWLTTINSSVGIWRWFEIYNDVGFVKNKGNKVYFAYENGVRLNFIQDILEVYFPMNSNLGWEISQSNYSSKIRFVLVIKPKRIYNFVKRGFY